MYFANALPLLFVNVYILALVGFPCRRKTEPGIQADSSFIRFLQRQENSVCPIPLHDFLYDDGKRRLSVASSLKINIYRVPAKQRSVFLLPPAIKYKANRRFILHYQTAFPFRLIYRLHNGKRCTCYPLLIQWAFSFRICGNKNRLFPVASAYALKMYHFSISPIGSVSAAPAFPFCTPLTQRRPPDGFSVSPIRQYGSRPGTPA